MMFRTTEYTSENAAVIDRCVGNLFTELTERDYPCTDDALYFIVRRWFEAKRSLIELLSKHECWDAKNLCIKLTSEFSRSTDSTVNERFFSWCSNQITLPWHPLEGELLSPETAELNCALNDNWRHISDISSRTITDFDIDTLCGLVPHVPRSCIPRAGMKTTRFVNKLLTECYPEISGHKYYEKFFAEYSDNMNPKSDEMFYFISVNPMDYLLSSYGNSWRTCHYIGTFGSDDRLEMPGGNCGGVLSYMLDTTSVVAYTLKKDEGIDYDEPFREPKITRCMFAIDNDKVIQQKIYPKAVRNNDVNEQYLRPVLSAISKCLFGSSGENVPDTIEWSVKQGDVRSCIEGTGSLAYPDWSEQSPEDLHVATLSPTTAYSSIPVCIGAAAYDICLKGMLNTRKSRLTTQRC